MAAPMTAMRGGASGEPFHINPACLLAGAK